MPIDSDVLRILRELRRVEFKTAEIANAEISIVIEGAGAAAAGSLRVAIISEAPSAGVANGDDDAVEAPLMGTFYRSPKPGAAPFAEEGQEVAADSVIGLIEVMKLMNSVYAGRAGRIAEFVARDGQSVGRGQALARFVRGQSP